MRYVQLKNGVIVKFFEQKPEWFWDDGTQVSDDWLVTDGIFRLIEQHRGNVDNYKEKDQSLWQYRTNDVRVTYYNYVDERPTADMVKQNRVLRPENQWITNENNSTITRTYDVVERNLEEIRGFVNSKKVYMPDGFTWDTEKFIEQPVELWEFNEEDDMLRKGFWEIIPDLTANEFSDILYIKEQTPFEEWPKTKKTAQEVINIIPREPIDAGTRLIMAAADLRWQIETGGLKIGEINMFTERETQAKLTSAYMLMKFNNSTADVTWKTIDSFRTFTAVEFENICLLVHQFVQNCYMKEALYMNEVKNAADFAELETLFSQMYTKLAVDNSYFIASLGQ